MDRVGSWPELHGGLMRRRSRMPVVELIPSRFHVWIANLATCISQGQAPYD
jgi:hypothetical protein